MRVWLSWSSGKDSAWALHKLRQREDLELVGLLTSYNGEADRVAMHGVRRELTRSQAVAFGLPIKEINLPAPCTNEQYEAAMQDAWQAAHAADVQAIAFGDLFLEDVRAYREKQLEGTGLKPLFPLWGSETKALAKEMLDEGLRAVLTCVDSAQLDPSFSGQRFEPGFLERLPEGVDPCGEKGEFHTFVYDGPMFAEPLNLEVGESLERKGFIFTDVRPA